MEENGVKVSWYGERGVVNAVIVGLRESGAPSVIAFLNAIAWAKRPAWIRDVKSVELIVEIGCGEFGDPDLIIVCTTKEGQRYATFVEVKVIPYETSAGSNQHGIRIRGYNSTINGQLSLKYRLAMSLSNWDGSSDELSESDAVYLAYKRPSQKGLSDTIRWPRHLKKPTVLSLLRNAGLAGLPLNHFHFVAWTWDRDPFFRSLAFHDSDQRPLFLDKSGNEQWQSTLPQLGWIGFKQISESDQLSKCLDDGFRDALATMRPTLEPTPVADISAAEDLPRVASYNVLKHCHDDTIQQLRALEKLAAEYFGEDVIEQKPGSSSVKYVGKVILKLVPQNRGSGEFLLLGVSTSLGRNDWGGHSLNGPQLIGAGNKAQPFFTIDLPHTNETAEIVSDIILDVAEICGLKTDGQ